MAKNKSLEHKRDRLYRQLGQFLNDFDSPKARRLIHKIWSLEKTLKIPAHKRIAL